MSDLFIRSDINLRRRLWTFKCLAKTFLGCLKPAHNLDTNVFAFGNGLSAQAWPVLLQSLRTGVDFGSGGVIGVWFVKSALGEAGM